MRNTPPSSKIRLQTGQTHKYKTNKNHVWTDLQWKNSRTNLSSCFPFLRYLGQAFSCGWHNFAGTPKCTLSLYSLVIFIIFHFFILGRTAELWLKTVRFPCAYIFWFRKTLLDGIRHGRLAGLLSAGEKLDGGAQFEFRAASEKANFVWIGCTFEALKTVSNSTQCLLFWVNWEK